MVFTTIPLTTRVPGFYAEFNANRANQGLALQPYQILVVTQRLATGETPALERVRITSVEQAAAAFGQGSMGQQMAEALLENNSFTPAYFIALDDPDAGVQATGTFTITGTSATTAGVLFAYIGGKRVQAAAAVGATPTVAAASLAAAINADANLPVTAAASLGVVTVTARHAGTLGNDIDLRMNYRIGESTPTGLAVEVAAMSNGAGFVGLDPVWDAIGDVWYNVVACPFRDSAALQSTELELERRFGGIEQIDGVAFVASPGDPADFSNNLTALSDFGATRNSPHVTIMEGAGSPSLSWERAAAYAGVAAFELANDPALPLQGVPLKGILPPAPADRLKFEERNSLLFSGIATTRVSSDDRVLIEFAITTWQKNALGLTDTAYLEVNTMFTLSYLRFSMNARSAQLYSRAKLAADGTRFGPGQVVVTPSGYAAMLLALYREWEEIGLVQDVDGFKADLSVTIDGDRLNVIHPPRLINQLRIGATSVQFAA